MMDTAGTVGVILLPVGVIAVILAMWYCPFRRASPSAAGTEAGNTSIAAAGAAGHPDIIANPYTAPYNAPLTAPSTALSYELDAHQSSRLSRISEEGGHIDHAHHAHHHHHAHHR